MKTRFAPSPTGRAHIGNYRVAFFNYLLARQNQGKFFLRIEDTDIERSQQEYVQLIQDDLIWLDLQWDPWIEREKSSNIYYQSKEGDFYQKYLKLLLEKEIAYHCFCSKERLQQSRTSQLSAGKPPRYDRKCTKLSKKEIAEKLASGEESRLRFRLEERDIYHFYDSIHGEREALGADISGDFIIALNERSPTFLFSNALDDFRMNITNVVRGEDHLMNTYLQVAVLQACDLSPPKYCHIPLILEHGSGPLSKRINSFSLAKIREKGFSAPAVLNYLFRLGHQTETNDLLDLSEMIKRFSENRLSRSPAEFNEKHLAYWQKKVFRSTGQQELLEAVKEYLPKNLAKEKLEKLLHLLKNEMGNIRESCEFLKRIFSPSYPIRKEEKSYFRPESLYFCQQLRVALELFPEDYSAILTHLQTSLNLKGKELYQPLRIFLTSSLVGPDLRDIFSIIPPDILLTRLDRIIKEIETSLK